MEPSFASQLHGHAPVADGFAYAKRSPTPQPELSIDETSDIARRFAPVRREQEASASDTEAGDVQPHAWPGHHAGADDFDQEHHGRDRFAARQEATPPAALGWPRAAPSRQHEPAFEDLYGRAVAIVMRDRKASSDHLRGCLHIGYMRASDLIERMEKEGVVGAPLYNGVRPILIGGPASSEI
jgi:DNA segregation ATPase FtsK/SpoIIIE-like protein